MGYLETDILEPSRARPILVDFWAPWCGPCRVLGPVLDKVAAKRGVTLLEVNIDEHQDVAQRLRIQSIPAVKLFDQGKLIGEFVGALPEREIEAWLDKVLPTDDGRALLSAKTALRAGDRAAARLALAGHVHEDSQSSEARALYAALTYFDHRDHALALAATVREGDHGYDIASAVRELDALDEKAIEPTAKANAAEAYRQGIASFRAADFANAAISWIDSMKASRAVAQDGAKRALIALFKFLGEDDPVTLEYRRAFASTLY